MRSSILSLAAAALALAGTTVVAPTASATVAPAQLRDNSGCSGDVCMAIDGTTGTVTVKAWAYDRTFTGHFQLLQPSGHELNGRDGTFGAGDVAGGSSWRVHADAGNYCVVGWDGVNGHFDKIGEPCLSL
ncbi:hypothetical protein ACFZB9_25030 [Kitasatospora sp. NPDC008050]|uniref:hypothetical protein n=1 Tax=Kitasatospora sp. NPDC008050 TaxID=3364021 RepID=UPI0036E17A91